MQTLVYLSVMGIIYCFSCPTPSQNIYTCSLQRSLAISLQSLSLLPLSTPLFAWRLGWMGGTDTNIFHTFFFHLQEVFQATWSSAIFFLGHAHQRQANECGETERKKKGFLLVFHRVYLTRLHLRFFSQVSNIHQSIRCPPPTEGLNGKMPWYDLLFCSQNIFTRTCLSRYLMETCHRCLVYIYIYTLTNILYCYENICTSFPDLAFVLHFVRFFVSDLTWGTTMVSEQVELRLSK